MGLIKNQTRYIPREHVKFKLCGIHPDWEMHPSWIAGIEALDAYNHWVAEVIMPIAFQWIEEHKAAVYESVDEAHKDDVGVVIASAFQLVKELSSYQNGLEQSEIYEEALKNGTWETATINPVWTGIAGKVRRATKKAFTENAGLLKDTMR
jgi:hypothetical protein